MKRSWVCRLGCVLGVVLGLVSCSPPTGSQTEATSEATSTTENPTQTTADVQTETDTQTPNDMATECAAGQIPEADVVAMTITNAGSEPVFVVLAAADPELGEGYFVERAVDLTDPDSQQVVNAVGICDLQRRCGSGYWCPYIFDEDQDFDPCEPKMVYPDPIKILPGGVYSGAEWSGLARNEVVLPDQCLNQLCPAPGETRCLASTAYTGELVASIRVGGEVSCAGESCDCTPSPGYDWCWVGGGKVTAPAVHSLGLMVPGPASLNFTLE